MRDKIVERVRGFVTFGAVADLEIARRTLASIFQVVALARRRKADAHAGCEDVLLGSADERHLAIKDIDELVLPVVTMLESRDGARLERSEIDPEVVQPELVAKLTLLSSLHPRRERRRIGRRGRSEEHTSELQSLMRISYDVFCLKKKNDNIVEHN